MSNLRAYYSRVWSFEFSDLYFSFCSKFQLDCVLWWLPMFFFSLSRWAGFWDIQHHFPPSGLAPDIIRASPFISCLLAVSTFGTSSICADAIYWHLYSYIHPYILLLQRTMQLSTAFFLFDDPTYWSHLKCKPDDDLLPSAHLAQWEYVNLTSSIISFQVYHRPYLSVPYIWRRIFFSALK